MSLRVAPCSHAAAKHAVSRWHYNHRMPVGKLVRYGVWESGRFVGAVIFGRGSSTRLGLQYDLDQTELCELVRVALREHQAFVSQVVGSALHQLKAANPGLRLVVSFADPEQGHHGGIYQAGNWIYAGMSGRGDEYMVRGRRMHGRALRKVRENHERATAGGSVLEWARLVLDPAARPIRGSSKHRYLYPLDRGMRRKVAPLAQPYPRGGSVDSDTSGLRPEEAGATPAHRSTLEMVT